MNDANRHAFIQPASFASGTVMVVTILDQDIESGMDTCVIYSFKEGSGVSQHPNSNRGAAVVNFAAGSMEGMCGSSNFVSLHGALMLAAWTLVAPVGLYYAR